MNDDNGNDPVTIQPTFDGMNPYQREILMGLNRLNRHVYSGTVSAKAKRARRAADRVAKASRKINRPA